jgi:hypothetical protein
VHERYGGASTFGEPDAVEPGLFEQGGERCTSRRLAPDTIASIFIGRN